MRNFPLQLQAESLQCADRRGFPIKAYQHMLRQLLHAAGPAVFIEVAAMRMKADGGVSYTPRDEGALFGLVIRTAISASRRSRSSTRSDSESSTTSP